MYGSLRRLLFLLPAEAAHHLGIGALEVLGASEALCRSVRRRNLRGTSGLEVSLGRLRLAHPIGLAAGLDKDGEAIAGLFALGFSSVEVGTVTPKPQAGNPGPRLFRLPEHQALINRMGFNNAGAGPLRARLSELRFRPGAVGANIGKNKETPIDLAASDYLASVDEVAAACDYLVVNASSPNTPGLRQLQEPERLEALLRAIRARLFEVAPGRPLFLKIAPDLSAEAVDAVVDVARSAELDGLICTNTTLARPVTHPLATEAGGLSGRPLRPLADRVLARAYLRSGGRLALWGVGGVMSAEDAFAKLRAGASAVQLYTGFVYGGPGLVSRMLRELKALLARGGFASVQDAVGKDAEALAGAGGW